MAARTDFTAVAADFLDLGRSVTALAARHTDTPVPGCTHGQAAQIITPGYHLAALAAETNAALRRMLHTYDETDACPLGSGAMAGQELPWDRARLAAHLGFARVQPHALVGVASRTWTTAMASDLAGYAAVLSRFTTDFMTWGGSGFAFLDLPDDLAGISAAMPQKRNFPVLERIRGRCAHVVGRAADLVAGQRNTPYSNTVEVSKEIGAHLHTQARAMRSLLRLTHAVVTGTTYRTDRMRAACAEDHLGGFTLANRLTLDCGIPWRTAQIVAGRYVKRAVEQGLRADRPESRPAAGLRRRVRARGRTGRRAARRILRRRRRAARQALGRLHPPRPGRTAPRRRVTRTRPARRRVVAQDRTQDGCGPPPRHARDRAGPRMTGLPAAARRVAVDIAEGTGAACGTFGELLQGVLPDGTAFLVTLPISLGSRARFPLRPARPAARLPRAQDQVARTGAGHARRPRRRRRNPPAGQRPARRQGPRQFVRRPRGDGPRAVGTVLGLDTSPGAVEDWLRPVEPTDGVMHPGVVVFEHRAVRLRAHLGVLPPVTVVAVDEGGHLDTVAHNRRLRHVPPGQRHEYERLVDDLARAVRGADLSAVGTVTTRSAVLNQRRLPKRNLDAMADIAERIGAPGVVCTHSGTMLGLLLDTTADGHRERLRAAARTACAKLPGTLSVYRSAAADR